VDFGYNPDQELYKFYIGTTSSISGLREIFILLYFSIL
jgi:hypothetical protein